MRTCGCPVAGHRPEKSRSCRYPYTGSALMTSVDVRTLPAPILIRLHLVSAAMMSEQEAEEATDWRHIALVTERDISRSGVSADEARLYRVLDAESQRI